MKNKLLLSRFLNLQVKFKISTIKSNTTKTRVFALVRKRNPLSLIFKTFLIIENFGLARVIKNKSDFLLVETNINNELSKLNKRLRFKRLLERSTNDNSRIINVSFSDSVVVSALIPDIISVIKAAKLENLYDFFN